MHQFRNDTLKHVFFQNFEFVTLAGRLWPEGGILKYNRVQHMQELPQVQAVPQPHMLQQQMQSAQQPLATTAHAAPNTELLDLSLSGLCVKD